MKKFYTLISLVILSVAASAQCTELYFSEYSEGSSNNKYLEIYNPTSSAVDLSTYSVFMINNGGSNAGNNKTFQLYGSLEVGGVFVICTDQSNASILAVADTALSYPSVSHFNGDDGVCLLNGTDTIDVIGVRWVDPGTNWAVGSGSTLNNTLVRKFSVSQGQLDWAVGATEWDVYAIDEWSYAGAHSSTCGPATEPSSAATNPTVDAANVISIYSETYNSVSGTDFYPNWGQSTGYSVFEIGSDSMIKYNNLNYQGVQFGSDVDASSMEFLHLDVWTADLSNLEIYPISRTTGEQKVTSALSAGEWTSIDIALSDYTALNLSMADLFQFKFVDPQGNNGTIFLDNIYFYQAPEAAPSTAAADPTAAVKDVISLFSNVYTDVTMDTWRTGWSAADLTDIQIGTNDVKKYSNLNFVGAEAVGANSIDASSMEYFTFDAWTPQGTTYRVKLVDFGADNAFGGGDDKEHEIAFENQTLESWNNHKIMLSDFTGLTTKSNISQIIFSAIPVGSTTLYLDNIYFSKNPTYTVADIADVIMLDADLAATNKGELYEITGIVYGVDLDGNAGLSFTLIDATAGINIYNFADVNDYVVTEGDDITVRGKIDFYNGLLELFPDSIRVNSAGNTLKDPIDVAAPSEATESNFIRLEKVWITNDTTTVWPNNGNVELTNEAKDTFQIRIDKDIPGIVGQPVSFDTMTIVGLGGQFDATAPYNSGYQIFPRGLADITEWVDRSSINDLSVVARVYPNPASNNLTVVGSENWNNYEVYNLLGSKVAEGTLYNNNLSISALVEGSYILKLHNAEKEGVAKFIVNK
jgi:hypothetical protein